MRVWIDQDLCTGDGLCTDHCPDVFMLLEDGLSYVHDGASVGNDPGGYASAIPVDPRHEGEVVLAALDCPGECIFVENEPELIRVEFATHVEDVADALHEISSPVDSPG